MEPQATRRPGEVVFTILMLAVSIFLFWQAHKISGFSSKSSPGAFPLAATAIMVIASVVTVLNTLRAPAAPQGWLAFRTEIAPNIVVIFATLILLYSLMLESIGFIIVSFTFLFAGILLLHNQGAGKALFWSLISIVFVYVIFRLMFKVVLPEGVIPERRMLGDLGALLAKLWGQR